MQVLAVTVLQYNFSAVPQDFFFTRKGFTQKGTGLLRLLLAAVPIVLRYKNKC